MPLTAKMRVVVTMTGACVSKLTTATSGAQVKSNRHKQLSTLVIHAQVVVHYQAAHHVQLN